MRQPENGCRLGSSVTACERRGFRCAVYLQKVAEALFAKNACERRGFRCAVYLQKVAEALFAKTA
jgi:hypothetical protein